MTADPRSQIKDFYDHLQTLDKDALAQQANYVDARAFNPRSPRPLLRLNTLRTAELQQSYAGIQEAFFDFAGRCMMCNVTKKHVHSVQGPPVLELEGCPGK